MLDTIRVTRAAVIAVAMGLTTAGRSAAQENGRVAAEFAAGVLSFADDGVVNEGMAGGAVRFYLSPRVSVGPEVSVISGSHHSHLMLTGNVTVDLAGPANGRQPAITPFAVFGAGLFQTRESFPNGTFTSNDGAFTAGGGVRARVGDRFFVGGEARVGWELHVRLSGLIGVRIGR